MKTNKPTFRVYLNTKRMFLSRPVIELLGKPTHLCFWIDAQNGCFIVTAASSDDVGVYEVPNFFWHASHQQSCEIRRIAFLTALKHRMGWDSGARYLFDGVLAQSHGCPAVVFDLNTGLRIPDGMQMKGIKTAE
jgi:hypothetical protein